MNHEIKYIKYKSKHIASNVLQYAGMPTIIIHICGPSGAGKTTLGNKLNDNFGNKIVVKDLDELKHKFIEEYYGNKRWTVPNKEAYQKYIDKYINEQQSKPLILVGLNNDAPFWNMDHYYDVHSTHNYYIKIDDMVVVKQKCLRFIKNIPNDEVAMADLMNNNKKFIKMVKRDIDMECNSKEIIKLNKKWNKYYMNKGYKFMSRDDIFGEVSRIINDSVTRS